MSGAPNPKRQLSSLELLGLAAGALLLAFPLGLPAAILGWRWRATHGHNREATRRQFMLAGAATVLCTLLFASTYPRAWFALVHATFTADFQPSLLITLFVMTPLAGAVGYSAGLCGRSIWLRARQRHPLDGRAVRDKEAARLRARRADLDERAASVPLLVDGLPVLGVRLDGIGDDEWSTSDLTTLPTSAAHVVAIGQSGSGKSESILRIAAAHLAAGWRVICIDAKEDHGAAARFRNLAISNGIDPLRALTWPEAGPMDLFRGPAHAVADRLIACSSFTESYYRAVAETLMFLVVADPAGRPRSLTEVVARLDAVALKTRWAGTWNAAIAARFSTSDIQGCAYRYFTLSTKLTAIGATNPEIAGWSWEDTDAAWITLPTSTQPGAAAAFGRALLVDLISYIRDPDRRSDPRPLLLVIEELGSIVSADPTTANLVIEAVERARSASVRAVLSVQTPEGLGDPDARARILNGGPAVLAHRMPQPEPIADLCGTAYGLEASLGIDDEGRFLQSGSVREQHQYRLPPGRIRELPTGQAVFVHQGCWSQVAIPRVGT